MCGLCLPHCPTFQLSGLESRSPRGRIALARQLQPDLAVDDSVVAAFDTCLQCRACEDFCETRAIRFRPQTGGRALPRIDTGACTGCGACIAPCPAGAITVIETRPAKAEATGPATETRPC